MALVNQPSAKFLKNQKTHLGAYDSGITAKHKIVRKPALSEIESILSIESHNSKNLSLVKKKIGGKTEFTITRFQCTMTAQDSCQKMIKMIMSTKFILSGFMSNWHKNP